MKEILERRKESEKQRVVVTTGSWIRAALVVIGVIALFHLREVVLILLTSIVIASAVEPAAVWGARRSIPRVFMVLFVYASTAIIFAGLFYFLILPLISEISVFIQQFPTYSNAIATDPVFSGENAGSGVFGSVANVLPTQQILGYLNSLALSLSRGAFSSASFFFGGVFSFIIIVILSFYLAVQEDGVGKFLETVTPWKHEKYVVSLWRRSRTKIGLWMQGQLLLAVIITVLTYLGLLLVGVEHALLLSVAAGFFEIIPLFGPIIAAIPAVIIAFADGGMTMALLVAGLFLIIQQFENHLIYPLVVKKVVGVPPMVSIIALLIGGTLAGFLGVLIAVPMATIVMELISDMEQEKVSKISNFEKSAT